MSYPRIIKEAALEKLFHTDLSLRHIADELGIPRATLHGWKRQYKMIKKDSETIETPAESWTPEENFAVVLESATLSEVELNGSFLFLASLLLRVTEQCFRKEV